MDLNPYQSPEQACDDGRPRPAVWLWVSTALAAKAVVLHVWYAVLVGRAHNLGTDLSISDDERMLAMASPLSILVLAIHIRGLTGTDSTRALLATAVWATVAIYLSVPLSIIFIEGSFGERWAHVTFAIAAATAANLFATYFWFGAVWNWHNRRES